MSVQLRTLSMLGTVMPRMKRAIAQGINSRMIVSVPDHCLTTGAGDDVTGIGKQFFYMSDDATRETWDDKLTLSFSSNSPFTSTREHITAMDSDSSGNVYTTYEMGDGELRIYNGIYDAGDDILSGAGSASQQIVAAGSDGQRYRAMDLSVSLNGIPAVAVYERAAATNQGAYIRVYIRLSDGTTWRKAYEVQIMTSQFIREGSEDVSISWGASDIVSNVGHLALYYTNTRTNGDQGDTLVEISFNVSTGTDGSATVVRTWASALNKNVAAGSRRGWIFKNRYLNTSDDIWVFGGIVGTASPYYIGTRLYHTTSTYTLNKTTNVPSEITSRKYGIPTTTGRAAWALQTCHYQDNRLLFAWMGDGLLGSATLLRCLLFRWSDTDLTQDQCVAIDPISRILDDNTDGVPLAVYAGINKRNTASGEYNLTYLAVYGSPGTDLGSSYPRDATVGIEHLFDAPTIIQPSGNTVNKNLPDFQLMSTSGYLYPNNHGLVQIQVASDAGFTTDLHTFEEAGDAYRIYQSTNGVDRIPQFATVTPTVEDSLFTGSWYWRARIRGDLGTLSDWASATFTIEHQPAALPTVPQDNGYVAYAWTDVTFVWTTSDNEPTDAQTAYQIVVTRADTGATVVDSGKVSSSTQSATLTISASYKEVPLLYSVKVWDADDTASSFSDAVRFTIVDAPLVLITSPVLDGILSTGLPTISWTFTAADRVQSYFRVQIHNLTDGTVAADTGWIQGTDTSYTFPSQVITVGPTYKALVYVRDSASLVSNVESNLLLNGDFERSDVGWTDFGLTSARSSTYKHGGSWSLELTPGGGATPWVITELVPVTAGHTYYAYMWVYAPLGYDSMELWINWHDSGLSVIDDAHSTVTVPAGTWVPITVEALAPVGAVWASVAPTYTGTPSAGDKVYVDDVYLKHTPLEFTATWASPTEGVGAASSDSFKATITWDDSGIDSDFVSWRVYRKYNHAASEVLDIHDTANTWEMIFETADVATDYEYRDYFAPLNKEIQYAVVQVVERDGAFVESDFPVSPPTVTITGDRYYFVPEIPIGAIASFEASFVTGDQFTRDIEQETLKVVGRGRQVQIGDDLGYTGTLTLKLRNPLTAREDREFIELLAVDGSGAVYIRSPFGDVIRVTFGSPAFSRMAGVGDGADLGDLTVPYTEVYGETLITRAAS